MTLNEILRDLETPLKARIESALDLMRVPGDAMICEAPRALQELVVEQAAAASKEFYGISLRPEVIHLPESGDRVWMLDPIDGTKGYLAARYYAIALGLFVKGRAVFGAMAVPGGPHCQPLAIRGALAFAVAGRGAWLAHPEPGAPLQFAKLEKSAATNEPPYRVAVSLEHGGALAGRLAQRSDVELVKLDIYLRESRKDGHGDVSWDHVPGAVIAREAGCAVRTFDGEDLALSPDARIDYGRGVACYQGGAKGPLVEVVRELTRESGL
jgi:3'-phosphoadenosine 5'-phosphosulfate (PAPS) 3'-phosphatase